MLRSIATFIVSLPVLLFPSASIADPYINIESNAGYVTRCSKCPTKYNGGITEFHIGYKGKIGEKSSYYFQGGPALVSESGNMNENEGSAKAGVNFELSKNLSVYGEVWTISDGIGFDGNQFTTKIGATVIF